ncbi:uncharacterized protein LOC111438358 isoform X2 [Cucurbita moschata]|uniref:Uncharacterized protein LOC111438358 isoform X2 n=1 Tax=Cucurbita moschata TaxID=3662 RepID=A0A6J1EVX2_CUCMO|nr:uncharacterized protein LOC111438358 isoform X2 [Cucurbita moschata]
MASLLQPINATVRQSSETEEQVSLLDFSSVSRNSSFKCYGKIGRTGGCHGIFFTTRAKGGIEPDVLEKDKEPIEVDVHNHYGAVGVHHVGVLCENLERSLHFYLNILVGLKINEARPHNKLPYRGAWLWVGAEMIHLMELPDPDPLSGRPEHGGRDRHTCIGIRDVSKLKVILDKAGIPYTLSKSGRPAISTRDPDANALEFTQVDG